MRNLLFITLLFLAGTVRAGVQASESFSTNGSTETCGSAAILDDIGTTTICAIFYDDGSMAATNGIFYYKGVNSGGAANGYRLLINNTSGGVNTIQFGAGSSGATGAPNRITASNSYAQNVWNYTCATWNNTLLGSNIHIYLATGTDRQMIESPTYFATNNGTTALSSDAAATADIGNLLNGATPRPMKGRLADLQIWNRLLSVNEMTTGTIRPGSIASNLIFHRNLANPNGADLSGNGNTCTQFGTIVANTDGPGILASGAIQ